MAASDTKPEPTPVAELESSEPKLVEVTPKREGGGFGRFMRRLFRIVLILVIVGGIGVGVYYAWPEVNDRFIQPVETNTAEVAAIQEQALINESVIADQASRIAELEALISTQGQTVAEMEGVLEMLTADVAGLSEVQAELELAVAAQNGRLGALDRLEAGLAEAATAEELARQIDILQATELMARARLFLYQSNYGLAEQDLAAARNSLAALGPAGSDADQAMIDEAILRLDLALAALPGRPVAASDDLDIAWQALLGDPPSPVAPAAEPESAATSAPDGDGEG